VAIAYSGNCCLALAVSAALLLIAAVNTVNGQLLLGHLAVLRLAHYDVTSWSRSGVSTSASVWDRRLI